APGRTIGMLPPRPFVVPFAQIVCEPPAEAGEGGGVRFTVTSAVAGAHGACVIVQRSVTGPGPLVWVKVAFGVLASGLKVPVTPAVTMDQAPVAVPVGALPPNPVVVAPTQ